MNSSVWKTLLGLSILALAVAPASADCIIDGSITAEMNAGDPELGAWCYTLTVTWDTGEMTALSHLDLIVDAPGGTCGCQDIADAINFDYPAGSSDGEPDACTVEYEAFLECNGDPSIPIEGILFKWEPLIDDPYCEPGPVGTGQFIFYSDYAPVAVDDSLPLVAEKNDGSHCEGTIDGVFPGLECNPVATEASTWSEVKSLYDQ